MTAYWKMVCYVFPYKSPFCLESAIISCPFKSVLEATSSHSAPSLYTHGHQGNCLYLPQTLGMMFPSATWDWYKSNILSLNTEDQEWSFITPPSLLPGWGTSAKPGSPSSWGMDVLCKTWPLPAYPTTWTPRRISSRFGGGASNRESLSH